MYGNDVNWKAGYGGTAEAVAANTRKIINLGLDKVTADINSAFATKFAGILSGLTGAMREAFLKAHPGAEFSGMTSMFAIDPKPISAGVDVLGQLAKAAIGVGTSADAAATAKANLTKETLKLTSAASQAAKLQSSLAKEVAKATASMNKQAQAASKLQYPGVNSKPGKGFRNPTSGSTKKVSGGPAYTLNGVTYYGSVAPKNRKKAQGGMHELLSQDTLIWAHAKERVDINKPGQNSRGGAGGHITVEFIPSAFKQFIRYSISEDQGYQK